MHAMYSEELVSIPCGEVYLEGVLAYPGQLDATNGVLLLGPHPHLGGTMDNNVVRYIAQHAAADGAVTLRFNYRGIGGSGIALPPETSIFDYYEDIEQNRRYDVILSEAIAASDWFMRTLRGLPIVLAGYSLGAVIAYMLAESLSATTVVAISPPVRMVHLGSHVRRCASGVVVGGDPDFAFDAPQCRTQLERLDSNAEVVTLAGCDHFFRKHEGRVYEAIAPWVGGGRP